jgi:V/A-type H+-transporting ATPase subunit I
MTRVAIVAAEERLRSALAVTADCGLVEVAGTPPAPEGEAVEALRRLERRASPNGRAAPRLAREPRDVAELERLGRVDLLAGEVELSRRAQGAHRHGRYAAIVGWTPDDALEQTRSRLAAAGAALVELPPPRWVEPPTLLAESRGVRRFRPLVDTYGAVRYADVDPTPFAAVAFVVMFGMMFADVGHGLLLAALGLWLRVTTRPPFASYRELWAFPVAAGLTAAFFGLLYGEAFGPTGLVPTVWVSPTEEPVELLGAAIGVGAALLTASYVLGTLNRWREGGPLAALLAPSGIAGILLFLGIGVVTAGVALGSTVAVVAGCAASGTGIALLATGFKLEAGRGAAAVTQATVEVLDAVIRVVANAISFARLAAFGLMHAALAAVVFDAASALWGPLGASVLAVAVFVVGNALTFALEALVAGVQALRLEYYELFSRVFAGEGHRFSPWHIPFEPAEEEP